MALFLVLKKHIRLVASCIEACVPKSMSASPLITSSYVRGDSLLILYIISTTITATPLAYRISLYVKRQKEIFEAEYEELMLEYLMHRTIVVCPKCSSLYEVKNLDEQLNRHWTCSMCKTYFEETPTHDIH